MAKLLANIELVMARIADRIGKDYDKRNKRCSNNGTVDSCWNYLVVGDEAVRN